MDSRSPPALSCLEKNKAPVAISTSIRHDGARVARTNFESCYCRFMPRGAIVSHSQLCGPIADAIMRKCADVEGIPPCSFLRRKFAGAETLLQGLRGEEQIRGDAGQEATEDRSIVAKGTQERDRGRYYSLIIAMAV